MPRPLVSVVMATYNRWHLLWRSLACYIRQDFPKDQFELIVIDDMSTDETRNQVLAWSHMYGIRTTVLTTAPKTEAWRDCGAVLNAGIRAARGEFIILTHPEVMPGRESVKQVVQALQHNEDQLRKEWAPGTAPEYRTQPHFLYACCKPYYLSPRDQERIDSVDWKGNGSLAVRNIEGFYDADQIGNPDYGPHNIEMTGKPGSRHQHWLSWVFGGMSRRTLAMMGGMLETSKWGSVDVAFMQRRQALGIANLTLTDDSTLCVHQNHSGLNDVPTPRIEDVWKQEITQFNFMNPESLRFPNMDHLGWRPY